MKTLVIYTHPNPNSFNHAILDILLESLESCERKYEVVDLYGDKFDPILRIRDFLAGQNGLPADVFKQQEKIAGSENLIFIHPTWWGGMPAMLKGYLDRVFTMGFSYTMDETGPVGMMNGKNVYFIRTTALSEEAYQKSGVEDLIHDMLRYKFIVVCGFEKLDHLVFYEVASVTDVTRNKYLDKVRQLVKNL